MLPPVLDASIRHLCSKLTKEELTNLVLTLMEDGLHSAGRKPNKKEQSL